jgi:hypothetical protein
MKKFAVTVDLPERYWDAQFYTEAEDEKEAESNIEGLLEALAYLVPAADLQVSDVEEIV